MWRACAAGDHTAMTHSPHRFPPLSSLPGATAPAASRRRHPRDLLQCAVTIALVGGNERQGVTVDMSRDGLSLSTDRPIAPGLRCVLCLHPPSTAAREPLMLQAKSVYSSYAAPGDFRIGMVFVGDDAQGIGGQRLQSEWR